jgi:hypothetical protein
MLPSVGPSFRARPGRAGDVLQCVVLVILAGSALLHCEPSDEARPPATAQDAVLPPPPATDTPPRTASADGEGVAYSSEEYAIGEDTDSYADNDPAALTDFHAAVDSSGTWVDDTTYGTVWTPSPTVVGADFTPYVTAGHWVYDDDWVWASDYPWGWAPFHYGRWVFIGGRGWAWIPGRVYRGAWVVWSVDDGYGYLGWAPAPPTFVWFGGVAVGWNVYVGPRWVYCPRREVFAPAIGTRIIAGPAVAPIAARARLYVPATPGMASGPPPQRIGFAATEIPHATGTASATVTRAQQFARPSTAQALGARPPMRFAPTAPSAPAAMGRGTYATVRPPGVTGPQTTTQFHTAAPGLGRVPTVVPSTPGGFRPSVGTSAPASRAPAPSNLHFGGGTVRSVGGGGHHR